jgi:hypothetical protein
VHQSQLRDGAKLDWYLACSIVTGNIPEHLELTWTYEISSVSVYYFVLHFYGTTVVNAFQRRRLPFRVAKSLFWKAFPPCASMSREGTPPSLIGLRESSHQIDYWLARLWMASFIGDSPFPNDISTLIFILFKHCTFRRVFDAVSCHFWHRNGIAQFSGILLSNLLIGNMHCIWYGRWRMRCGQASYYRNIIGWLNKSVLKQSRRLKP